MPNLPEEVDVVMNNPKTDPGTLSVFAAGVNTGGTYDHFDMIFEPKQGITHRL